MNRVNVVVPQNQSILSGDDICGEVQYSKVGWQIYATIVLNENADKLTELPELPKHAKLDAIYVITSQDSPRRQIYSLQAAHAIIAERRREEERQCRLDEFKSRLQELSAQRDNLTGQSTCRLNTLIQSAYYKHSQLNAWRDPSTPGSVEEAIRAVHNEIQRLTSSEPLEVMLQALLREELGSPSVHYHNKQVLTQLETLAIRSGGKGEYAEIPSLENFYGRKLVEASVTDVNDLQRVDLRLVLGDYAILDESDPDIWAPKTIPFPDILASPRGAKNSLLEVYYFYDDTGGRQQAVARVVVPLKAFSRSDAREALEAGTLLPELPHENIQWRGFVSKAAKSPSKGSRAKSLPVRFAGSCAERGVSGVGHVPGWPVCLFWAHGHSPCIFCRDL
ncbi:MAG TPA: hypothetical protein VFZ58_03935 [Candidatus Saccharimonadales bacterium]